MSGIYVASKVKHAELWKALAKRRLPICSRWLDYANTDCDYAKLWSVIVEDLKSCDALVFYIADEDDFPIKGAFVEAGAALALSKPIFIAIGDPTMDVHGRPLGTWIQHPLVRYCRSLDEALLLATSEVWRNRL